MGIGSVVLRLLANGIRVLQFCAGAIILGIFSYFLAVLRNHNLPIATWMRAVEGLSGAATLYALFGSILTFCLGGMIFFGAMGIILDIGFVGSMIAIAIMTRDGTNSCNGNVHTPLGDGPSDSQADGYGSNGFGFGSGQTVTYFPNLGLACRLEKTAFAVSIISIFLFLASIFLAIPLVRDSRREYRYGPSPANGYTSGSRGRHRGFWRRNKNTYPDQANGDALPGFPTPGEVENGYKPETTGYNSTRF